MNSFCITSAPLLFIPTLLYVCRVYHLTYLPIYLPCLCTLMHYIQAFPSRPHLFTLLLPLYHSARQNKKLSLAHVTFMLHNCYRAVGVNKYTYITSQIPLRGRLTSPPATYIPSQQPTIRILNKHNHNQLQATHTHSTVFH